MTNTDAGEVRNQLEALFASLMSDSRVPVQQRTQINSAAWDSFFHLTLVLAIEQEFGVTLTDVDVLELSSFASALDIVVEKLAAR